MDKYSIQKKKVFEWEKGLIIVEQENIQYQQIMIKLPTLNNQTVPIYCIPTKKYIL